MITTFIIIPLFQLNRYNLNYFTVDNINGVRKLRKQLNRVCSNNVEEDNFKIKLEADNLNMFLQSNSGNIYPFFIKKKNDEEYIFSLWVFHGSTLCSLSLKEINLENLFKINEIILDYEQNDMIQCTQCLTKINKNTINKHFTGIYCDSCWEGVKPIKNN